MPYSQGLSNNAYPESNQLNFSILITISLLSNLILTSHLRLGLSKDLFPVGLPVKILKALPPSFILATSPVYLNLLYLITITKSGERYKLEVLHCGAFSTPHTQPSWAQILASVSCGQILFASLP
jgi:hypothetical protein